MAILGAAALETTALLTSTLYRAAEQDAGREARLVAHVGLASARSSGPLTAGDLKLAAREYAAAEKDVPLTGAALWTASGAALFFSGSGRADEHRRILPRIVRTALATGREDVTYGHDRGVGAIIEAAVPLGPGGLGAVVEFHFTRAGVEQNLSAAKRRLYELAAIGASVVFLIVLPLLAHLARRVPLPVDPSRKAALAELGGALAKRELVVHYQPKIALADGSVVGVEALVRWDHPRMGIIGPGGFLPLAESSPSILADLTLQVLDRATGDCAGWLQDGLELPVAVNLPATVLLDGSMVKIVKETLSRHRLAAHLLTIELTEGALIEPGGDVIETLHELRSLGISVSIDDFGTGHSSLARLRSIPLDELKVDRSFIADVATDEQALGITRHIIDLGNYLGLRVVAEGVEDERTLELLRASGCWAAQGFYFAKALTVEQLREWLELYGRDAGTSGCANAA